MIPKITIVSTYPEFGSKNIGDKLITNSLLGFVKEIGDYNVEVVWRAAPWDSVKDAILSSSHIFFACLAMRPEMHRVEYPYLKEILDSDIPFSVIAAGTDLAVGGFQDIYGCFSSETVELLGEVNEKAVVATTRGVLSQEACLRLRLNKFVFSGDVAFYREPGYEGFSVYKDVKKIVVSDPHRPKQYIYSFQTLYAGIVELFPEAEIVVAQHGVNKVIDKYCNENNISTVRIYQDPDNGLDIYNDADLHVGYRVHAHVSALKRGVYSYLLEQDGRGCDYGLTLGPKLSVPSYPVARPVLGIKSAIRCALGKQPSIRKIVPISYAQQIVSMIRADKEAGFIKFKGLESEIDVFNENTRAAVRLALTGSRF